MTRYWIGSIPHMDEAAAKFAASELLRICNFQAGEIKQLRELALKVCDCIERCSFYGPADQLREWAWELKDAAELAAKETDSPQEADMTEPVEPASRTPRG